MSTLGLRPVTENDLVHFQRLRSDPEYAGLDWDGFQDPAEPARQFARNGMFGGDSNWLAVEREGTAVALVNWRRMSFGLPSLSWEIGIVVVPEHRGQGVGWRAQAMLCDYLFRQGPVQRIQAGTRVDNVAEQKALVKAGFQLEGTIRSADFRDGAWRDALLYSRLRTDPAPAL